MKQNIPYWIIGIAALIFAAGFLISQYFDYKQLQLSQQKAIQDCIERTVGNDTGFLAANKTQKCRGMFSQ